MAGKVTAPPLHVKLMHQQLLDFRKLLKMSGLAPDPGDT
jgi:hypothetical protein